MTTAIKSTRDRVSRRAPYAAVKLQATSIGLWMPIVVFYSMLLPAGMQYSVGTILLVPYRLTLLVIAPLALSRFMANRQRLVFADYAIAISIAWMFLSMSVHEGFGDALQAGGLMAIDYAVPYLIARATLRTIHDLRALLKAILPAVIVMGASMAFEAISHRLILQQYFPTRRFESADYHMRLGLLRAWGPFAHPIGGGLFLTSLMPLYWFGGRTPAAKYGGSIAALCGIFSISSAAFINAVSIPAILTYAILASGQGHRFTWRSFLTVTISIAVAIQVFASGGIGGWLARNIVLDAGTARFRLLIWEFGSKSVVDNPLFGIGYGTYERLSWMVSGTVDNFWLNMAMRYGIVPAITFLAAVVVVVVKLTPMTNLGPWNDRKLLLGLQVSIGCYALMAWSVNLWSSFMVLFTLLIGMAQSMSSAPEVVQRRKVTRVVQRAKVAATAPAFAEKV